MCSSFQAICPKHAVSLHLDMYVCVCACVCGVSVCVSVDLCAYICLRVNDQEWFRGMSVGALFALKKKLFLCVYMWARPCGCCFVHIQLSQSPTLWSHLYLNGHFLFAYSQNKQYLVWLCLVSIYCLHKCNSTEENPLKYIFISVCRVKITDLVEYLCYCAL